MSTTFSGPVISDNGFTGNLTGNLTGNVTGLVNGAGIYKITETVGFAAFTDGGGAVGDYDLATQLPAGALFLFAQVEALTGFAGDTSATLQIGDGTDVDRYNTGTPDVFTTAATGIDVGAPSGLRHHTAAATVKLTITTAADWTSVSAGSITVSLYYLT